MNNNNKNNSRVVRAVSEFYKKMFKVEDIFEAYYDCLKNKRSTESAIKFEMNYIRNCISLYNDLSNRTYRPSSSIAFIVTKPRKREIFAANFRDRVLHHLVDLKLRPLIEKELIDRTFNNRIGKGTSGCVAQLKKDLENCTPTDWICKMDMKGFFMSLSKSLIISMVHKLIDDKYIGEDKEDLKWLITVLISDNPEKYCIRRSAKEMWDDLDKNKSLFTIDDDLGLPIGNLISQLFANFYLNDFDHFVHETLGFEKYGRYVDDFYIIGDKDKILNSIPLMREKLKEVGIKLHPDKFYMQHVSKGCEMVGAVVKKNRMYVHNRTVNNAFRKIERMTSHKRSATEKDLASVNSYLGFMGMYSSYNIRRKLAIQAMALDGLSAPNNYKKMKLSKQYNYGRNKQKVRRNK